MKSLVLLLVPLLLASVASADVIITLTDGSTVQGTVKPSADGYVVTKADGSEQLVPSSMVRSLKPTSSSSTAGGGASSLESLRRATANIDDLNLIIRRYQAFVTQNASSPAAKDAQQDLAMWQDRADKKMVKAGGTWVTPEEYEKLRAGASTTAKKIVAMVSEGKLKEATTEADRALALTPGNADLQYLKGIIAFKLVQMGPAKTAFQAAGQSAPSHGPSHNNAAVALVKIRDAMPALAEFEKAMLALPNNQTVLDNVAETLYALPAANQNKELTKKVRDLFNQQDLILQRQMESNGKHRWGSQWLDNAEYAVVQARQKEQQDKLDAIKKDYDNDQARIRELEQRITADATTMQQMLQYNVGTNPQGQQVQLPPPPQYYNLQRDQLAMQTERDQKTIELRTLEREYNQQAQIAIKGSYSGVLKIFEADAIPSAPPPASTPPAAPTVAGQMAPSTTMTPGTTPPGMPTTAPSQPTAPKPKGPGDY
jgi:Flp pilus assembly protein TadD